MASTVEQKPVHEAIVDSDTDAFEEWVLATALHSNPFFFQVANVLCHDHMTGEFKDDFRQPVDNGIWQMMVDYHGQTPGLKAPVISINLAHAFLLRLANEPKIIALSDVADATEKVARLLGMNIAQLEPMVRRGFEYWLTKVRIGGVINDVTNQDGWTPREFKESLATELKGVDQTTSKQQHFDFGHGIENDALDVRRISTGFLRLDPLLGGGLGEGEGTLMIAATGAGKTAVACQMGSTMALDGAAGVIITTEESHIQLEPRIISCHCSKIPFSLVKDGVKPERFSQDQLEQYKAVRKRLTGKLSIFDWSADRDKSVVADLDSEFLKFQEK